MATKRLYIGEKHESKKIPYKIANILSSRGGPGAGVPPPSVGELKARRERRRRSLVSFGHKSTVGVRECAIGGFCMG